DPRSIGGYGSASEAPPAAVDLEPDERAARALDAPPRRELVDEPQAEAGALLAHLGVEAGAGVEDLDAREARRERGGEMDVADVAGVLDAVGEQLGGQQPDRVLEGRIEARPDERGPRKARGVWDPRQRHAHGPLPDDHRQTAM